MRYILILLIFISGCTIHKNKEIDPKKLISSVKLNSVQKKDIIKQNLPAKKKQTVETMTATQKKLLELYQNKIISKEDYNKGSAKLKKEIKNKDKNLTLDDADRLHKSAVKLSKLAYAKPAIKSSEEELSWQNYDRSPWYISNSFTGITGAYSGSSQRDKFYSLGFTFSGEYLESRGFTVGYTNSTVVFKDGVDSTRQNEFFVGLHKNFNRDGILGTFDLRLNSHYITNNDSSGDSDKVKVLAPLLSYISYKKSYYLDLGYAFSLYQNSLSVNQLSPTIGFAFNNSSDWLQLRGYFIFPSNNQRAAGIENTKALQGKWTHWFALNNTSRPNTLSLSAMLGERIYSVDFDSLSVYNLSDVQKGSVAIDISWKLNKSTDLILHAGHDLYENVTISENYSSTTAVLSISKEW
ncbi:MAG: hypothetical protein HQL71_09700 [Magnetococcales bacterium]|nr:hypothetical protein [Magnetococcales bacterium]